MSPFTFDAESGDIGPGDHDVEIVEVSQSQSKAGNDQLKVVFEDSAGAQIADWLVYKQTVAWKWQQLWEAAGLSWTENGGKVDVNESDLISKRVHIDVFEDEWNGQVRAKVKAYSFYVGSDIPADDAPSAPADAEDDEEAPF